MYNLAWAIVLVPLGAVGLSYVTESPRRAAQICIGGTAASFVMSVVLLIYRLSHISQNPYQSVITFWTYAPGQTPVGFIGDFHIQVGILVDGLSTAILPVVTLVSLLIQVYSVAYMRGDPGYRRFFVIIGIFTFSMLGLVASPNLFNLYLMWEGVGVCSYLLIGHWWHRPAAAAAAKKAFLVTRIGDLGLFLGIVFIFSKFAADVSLLPANPQTEVNDPLNFQILGLEWQRVSSGQVLGAGSRSLVVMALLVLLGAVGKSAQLPLHTWLPDAMEGPTPISALIHAATMVAAGVYLVARLYPLFLVAPHVMTVVAVIGACTAVFAAVVALAHTDIKRIIAWSTVSHLGLMFTALGVGAFTAGVFHLFTHAWFKALLFLAAGNIIAAYGTQDIREMGGAWRRMRGTSLAMLAGCCSASGVIIFAGFWSKDSIVAGVLRNEFPGGGHVSRLAQALLLVAVCTTSVLGAMYPFRMFFLAFCGQPARRRGFQPERVREAPPAMLWPVIILGVLATIAGFIGIEGARYTFGNFVYTGSPGREGFSAGGLLLGGGLALLGVLVAALLWWRPLPVLGRVAAPVRRLGALAADGFRVDAAYAWLMMRIVALARLPVRFDRELTDAVAGGAVESVGVAAGEMRRLQTGRLQIYAISAMAGVVLVVGGITLAATGHFPGVGAAR